MNYKEAWNETFDRLVKAGDEINEQIKIQSDIRDYTRLRGKLEGIQLAKEYMQEINSSISRKIRIWFEVIYDDRCKNRNG